MPYVEDQKHLGYVFYHSLRESQITNNPDYSFFIYLILLYFSIHGEKYIQNKKSISTTTDIPKFS